MPLTIKEWRKQMIELYNKPTGWIVSYYKPKERTMSEQTTTSKKPDLATCLRQMAEAVLGNTLYPDWFGYEIRAQTKHNQAWADLLNQAADKVEQYDIQNDSYSRLCKQVYGNG